MNRSRLFWVAVSAFFAMALCVNSPAFVNGQSAATPAATMAGTANAVNLGGNVSKVYVLPDLPLGATQNEILKDSIKNDRKMLVGGIGSDLWHGPKDAVDEFWMISDRGPNGQIKVDNVNRRTFPVPEFDPTIYHVKLDGANFKLLEVIPIITQSGKPVTGLSNLADRDEVPYDYAAKVKLDFNQNGLDTEGLVRTSAGDFWSVEEYGPSLLKIDKTGKVLKRYLPEGLKYDAVDYPVAASLPAIFALRKGNRGFEGLALSPDEKTLYIALQSPLSNPDKKTGDPSRQTRILVFDIASEKPTAEYVYQFDDAKKFGGDKNTPDEMKVSSIVALNATTLLVGERTDLVIRLYTADLSSATNILGTAWDDMKTAPSLEALTDLAASKVTALPKTFVIEASKLPEVPGKIEGLAVLDKNTVVLANDNDFDIGTFGEDGNNKGSGAKSKIVVIKLEKALP